MRRPSKPRFAARLHSSSTGALKRLETSVPPHAGKTGSPLRPAGEATPMLRHLSTKFIALNMALAALVLAASFATICYADYRADIDDVHNRLMTATSRSLQEPQLIPDAEPFHRGDGPREGRERGQQRERRRERKRGRRQGRRRRRRRGSRAHPRHRRRHERSRLRAAPHRRARDHRAGIAAGGGLLYRRPHGHAADRSLGSHRARGAARARRSRSRQH